MFAPLIHISDAMTSIPKPIAQQGAAAIVSATPATSSSSVVTSASVPLMFDLSESMAAKLPDLEKLKAQIDEKNSQIGTLKSQVCHRWIFVGDILSY